MSNDKTLWQRCDDRTLCTELPGIRGAIYATLDLKPPLTPPDVGDDWPVAYDKPGILVNLWLPADVTGSLVAELRDGNTRVFGELLYAEWGIDLEGQDVGHPDKTFRVRGIETTRATLIEAEEDAKRLLDTAIVDLKTPLRRRHNRLVARELTIREAYKNHGQLVVPTAQELRETRCFSDQQATRESLTNQFFAPDTVHLNTKAKEAAELIAAQQPEAQKPKMAKRRLLWMDLETTGLDPDVDQILEIAMLIAPTTNITSGRLIFDNTLHYQHDPAARLLDQVVLDMHSRSGLWEECRTQQVDVAEAEQQILRHLEPDTIYHPAGSSVHFDVSFIRLHMPDLYRRLSHQHYDVSAMLRFVEAEGIEVPARTPSQHRALPDTLASIDLARMLIGYVTRVNK